MKKVIKLLLVSVALGVSMISTSAAVDKSSITIIAKNDRLTDFMCRNKSRFCRR